MFQSSIDKISCFDVVKQRTIRVSNPDFSEIGQKTCLRKPATMRMEGTETPTNAKNAFGVDLVL